MSPSFQIRLPACRCRVCTCWHDMRVGQRWGVISPGPAAFTFIQRPMPSATTSHQYVQGGRTFAPPLRLNAPCRRTGRRVPFEQRRAESSALWKWISAVEGITNTRLGLGWDKVLGSRHSYPIGLRVPPDVENLPDNSASYIPPLARRYWGTLSNLSMMVLTRSAIIGYDVPSGAR